MCFLPEVLYSQRTIHFCKFYNSMWFIGYFIIIMHSARNCFRHIMCCFAIFLLLVIKTIDALWFETLIFKCWLVSHLVGFLYYPERLLEITPSGENSLKLDPLGKSPGFWGSWEKLQEFYGIYIHHIPILLEWCLQRRLMYWCIPNLCTLIVNRISIIYGMRGWRPFSMKLFSL